MEKSLTDKFKSLIKNSDMAVALGLLLILIVMVVPIHPVLLDIFIAISFSISIMILLVCVYAKRPLDFSTFPSLLLITTLFRLSLNVASTRSILLRAGTEGTAAAGSIIQSFGEFVVEGNYIVGLIVFIILVTINFLVITKGAGRVAEVAARFTLDAMPGKQMAIDADLNAGLINEKEARTRRSEIAQEADFYGSMDGASKFVRGDAIASILITIINIIGGIIVGVVQYDMSALGAAETFTLLTVGDGLITQIPALIISTAAGIIATRSSSDRGLGDILGKQLSVQPKVMFIVAGVLFIFGLIPGLPAYPFFILGVSSFLLGHKIEKTNTQKDKDEQLKKLEEKKAQPESLETLLPLELIELEVGYGLVSLVDNSHNATLLDRITHIRKQFALDWGMIIPSVRIRDNLELKSGSYKIKIKGIEVAQGELQVDGLLAMDSGTVIDKIDGIETKEPVFGLPAIWINEDQREDAQYNGYTVVDTSTILATHLTEVLRANLHELLGRQELERILDNFKEQYPKIISDLIPSILPVGTVLKVMQNLLKEGISVRDLRTILEVLAEYGTRIKDAEVLTENARQALYRTITESIKSENGEIPLFTLDRNIEESIAEHIVQTDSGPKVSLDPKVTQSILASLNDKLEEATQAGEKMIILCSPVIRSHFKKMTEKFIPKLTVIGHNELTPDAKIRALGTVRM